MRLEEERLRIKSGSIESKIGSGIKGKGNFYWISVDILTDSLLKCPCEPRTLLEYFVSAAS